MLTIKLLTEVRDLHKNLETFLSRHRAAFNIYGLFIDGFALIIEFSYHFVFHCGQDQSSRVSPTAKCK